MDRCLVLDTDPWLQDLRDDDSLFLESDADEQLLIHVGFSSGAILVN